MGPKHFQSQNFSLFIVKFKKLGFSAQLYYELFVHNREIRTEKETQRKRVIKVILN